MSDYPNDADGGALRRVAGDGSDMSRPMSIDFTIAVPSREVGEEIGRLVAACGYVVRVEQDTLSRAWTCYCTKSMVATYDSVVAAQRELNFIAHEVGGHCDGWGTFGNAGAA